MEPKKPKSSIEDQIEENLKKVYQQKVTEQVPDTLLELISKLRAQDSQQ